MEILYVAGCPHLAPTRQIVEQLLAERGLRMPVQSVAVSEQEAGAFQGFAGSPTVLVNGHDVEPGAPAGMACRIYAGGAGVPSREACERAIDRAMKEEAACNGVL
ncbi:MAG: DF family (seleno)protein [Candidatus Acidiferrales bacterium]